MADARTAPPFNAKAVGLILLTVLVVLVLEGATLNSVLYYLRDSLSSEFLRDGSDEKLAGARYVVSSVLDPAVLMGTTFLLLKRYFPAEDFGAIASRFGLRMTISPKVALISFVVGVVYVVLFTEVLMKIFPPSESVARHPANAAAATAVWAQLIFAISAATIVPVVEEFFFRGVLYEGLSAQWNKIFAAIAVSVIFILFHPDALRTGYWLTHLGLYLIPFTFVIAREVTGSLASPIMIHSGFNFTEAFF